MCVYNYLYALKLFKLDFKNIYIYVFCYTAYDVHVQLKKLIFSSDL